LSQCIRNVRVSLFAFAAGFIYSQFFLPFPVIYVPLMALALFHTYYYLNRGGSIWLVLMLLICLLIMPMLAGTSEGLAVGVILGLIGSSILTIALLWLVHYLVPDIEGGPLIPKRPGYQSGYSAPAAMFAVKSTLVVLPIAVIFIANNWTSQILVLVFTATFTLAPDLDKGRVAGQNAIKSTLIGGGVAFFVYWALVAVPEYHFLILLMFLVSFGFGVAIYSARPISQYLPSAMVAMIILVNSSLDEGADFSENFIMRIVFISMAAIYVVTALKVLNVFCSRRVAQAPGL